MVVQLWCERTAAATVSAVKGVRMSPLTRSYVHGASPLPLMGETIGEHFDRACHRWAGCDALIVRHQGVHWSYADLQREVERLAAGLLALGLEPGERVGIWALNDAEWAVTQFATAKAGLILVNINPGYRSDELEFALNRVGCAALVTADRFKSSDYIAMLQSLLPELAECEPGRLRAARVPTLRTVIRLGDEPSPGMWRYEDVCALGGEAERRRLAELGRELQFDDPINIQFTSGTTGTPKAATLTHHNILNNAFFVGETLRLSEHDRICIPVPMYHCFGMVLGTLMALTHGCAAVFPSEAFEPGAVLATVEAESCTVLHGVPTMFIAELDALAEQPRDLSNLRTGIMAGAPCPEELMRRVTSELHIPEITIAYGMTETGPVSFQTAVDDPLEQRVTTVGRVLPHTEVKIVDEEGRVVPPDTSGELLTRGYLVMRDYWGDPERTAAAIDAAGWIASGDLAAIDEQGYCRIVGRLKEMVIRGGENLFPREIEEFLFRHPAVDDAQVFGVPDAKFGEELCAWIKLREGATATEDEIREFCRGRIAHFKIPRYIRFVDEFPMTVTGKVQKFVMREQMIEELGPGAPAPS